MSYLDSKISFPDVVTFDQVKLKIKNVNIKPLLCSNFVPKVFALDPIKGGLKRPLAVMFCDKLLDERNFFDNYGAKKNIKK